MIMFPMITSNVMDATKGQLSHFEMRYTAGASAWTYRMHIASYI